MLSLRPIANRPGCATEVRAPSLKVCILPHKQAGAAEPEVRAGFEDAGRKPGGRAEALPHKRRAAIAVIAAGVEKSLDAARRSYLAFR